MIPDIDIWRCAALMIKHHGDMRSLSVFYLVATLERVLVAK